MGWAAGGVLQKEEAPYTKLDKINKHVNEESHSILPRDQGLFAHGKDEKCFRFRGISDHTSRPVHIKQSWPGDVFILDELHFLRESKSCLIIVNWCNLTKVNNTQNRLIGANLHKAVTYTVKRYRRQFSYPHELLRQDCVCIYNHLLTV